METIQIPGLRLGTARAGIKRPDRDDILLIEADRNSAVAAVFTKNAFAAAPVLVARENLDKNPRWILVNSGNANAGTGTRGLIDARSTCAQVAELTQGKPEQVLPFSTGVIGEFLPVDKIMSALPQALLNLKGDGWEAASRAIMTTDTRPKLATRSIKIKDQVIRIAGIAKGSGMIEPNMATMLAFIATDAKAEPSSLQRLLTEAANQSFNAITVDGDTSTNDSLVLIATGASDLPELKSEDSDFAVFEDAIVDLCKELAEAIILDGEGATKLIRINVEEALNRDEARKVGKTIANSPLVKTAFFAGDPNWGRILAAVGRSGCTDLDLDNVSIYLDAVQIVSQGARAPDYEEQAGAAVMAQEDITITVKMGRGNARDTVLTCDFSYEYVRINAEYRT